MDLDQILFAHPTLTVDGYDDPARPGFAADRARLAAATDQIDRAAAWLRLLPRVKAPNLSSYWMKHVAEDWAGNYVSNGALIAAALMLGIVVVRVDRHVSRLAVAAPARWPEGAVPKDSTMWLNR